MSISRTTATCQTERPPLAVGPVEAARLVDLSDRELRRLRSQGLFPAPDMALSARSPRWSVEGLQSWLSAGCPTADKWTRMRQSARGGAR